MRLKDAQNFEIFTFIKDALDDKEEQYYKR